LPNLSNPWRRTAATLSPDESITAIVLVALDELFPSRRPGPRKVSERPQASSSQRRPTSDLLNEELLNQLLGRLKRSSRAEEESVQKQVVKAKVTYDRSLFPPSHEISYEETFTVMQAPICKPQQASAQKTKLRKDKDYLQIPGPERLTTEETETAAESIVRVLSEVLRFESNSPPKLKHSVVPPLAIIEANSYFNLSKRMRILRKMAMKRPERSGRGCTSTVKEVELA
jgi:hypothetical protein